MATTVHRTAQNPTTGFTLDDLEAFVTDLQVAGLDPSLPITARVIGRVYPDGLLLSLQVTSEDERTVEVTGQ